MSLDTNGISNSLQAGFLDLNGTNETIAGLSSVTCATMPQVVNAIASVRTLTINASGNFSYAGTIRNDIALVKSGAGFQTLSGANSYTGGTTVNGGTLTLTHVLAASNGTLNVTAGRACIRPVCRPL